MTLGVLAAKGGVGKTILAVHLARVLADHAPTAILDADPLQSAAQWARRARLPLRVLGTEATGASLREVRHIVIDTAPRLTLSELRDLARLSDLLLLPLQPDSLALDGLIDQLQTLRSAGIPTPARVVLTRTPAPPCREVQQLRDFLAQELRLEILHTEIRNLRAFSRAHELACTVDLLRRPGAATAWRLCQELVAEIGEVLAQR